MNKHNIHHPRTLRRKALTAGLAVSFAAVGAGEALAQAQTSADTSTTGAVELAPISVEGRTETETPPNTLKAETGIGRLPGTVQDTPQIVNVVPKRVLEEQNVTSLEQALRNVPGVTIAIGEGGPSNGDQFRIRGFAAQSDIYSDGLRDFGLYVRDSFNYEEVQVIKGPSSESFGMGTTGGAINTQSKTPKLQNFVSGTISGGSGPQGRGTVDVNRMITDTIAVRLNGMYHNQEAADRDVVESERWGVAGSIGFGIGTGTEFTMSYFHQEDDRVPDYGIPVFGQTPNTGGPGFLIDKGKPSTEYGIDRDNFYGFDSDTDETQVDMFTARLEHEVTDWLTFYNDTRVTTYDRYFQATQATCNAACVAAYFGVGGATVSRGGPSPYDQEGWAAQNVSTLVGNFNTGPFRHQLVVGADLFKQNNERQSHSYSPGRPGTGLENPANDSPFDVLKGTGADRETDALNLGFFASDRLWLTDEISVLGGVRFDSYDAKVDDGLTTVENKSDLTSPKASLIWEPTNTQTYYLSWAKSSSPQGQFISSTGNPVSSDDLKPETSELWEIGAKIGLFDERLGLSGAIFYIDKDNAKQNDPVTGDILANSGEKQRVKGVEIGISGRITDAWIVTAGYTYLDPEIREGFSGGRGAPVRVDDSLEGNQISFVPKHAASVWTTYDLSDLIIPKDLGRILIGTGITYRDEVYLNSANTSIAPETFSWDGLVSYEYANYRLALNAYNLTDELNYDQVWGNRVVPSAGRTFVLTAGVTF